MAEREIAWLKPARKSFEDFPPDVRVDILTALTIAARGDKADSAKPSKGVGGGIYAIALKRRGDAFRAIYAVQIGAVVWVVDAFQKKSTKGVKTAQVDVERIKRRIKLMRYTYA